ncbi:MAG TPA: branched-chain amino acid ABC transporter ATP-binding protein/permease [Mycobacterium sp.]|jgi:branched-chain amino acid transport system permease protein|nr:branched-chain amino acid ABC transporter ATP-binding protein/permease [Mycobacterium sp.]
MTATVSSTPSKPSKQAVPTLRHVPPGWIGRIIAALATAAVLAYPLVSDDTYYQNMIIISLVFAIGASGLNIITGFTGYVSLGQSAFIGLGGYTIGVLATKFDTVSPWLWVPVAGLVAAAVAVGLGLVSLRSRGPAFVIITVAFLFLMQQVAVNWEDVTGGTAGLLLPLPTWGIDVINWPFYYALVAILAVQLLMTWWIRRSKFGMGLIAIREDETKAATIGINLPVHKVAAFVASSVFVGMAGAVYGYYLTFIDPLGMFAILISVQIILTLLVGGKATLWGPVLGAFLIEPLNETVNNSLGTLGGGNARLFLFGGLLMAVVVFLPNGILPSLAAFLFRRSREGKAGLVGARIETGGSLESLRKHVTVTEARATDTTPLLAVTGLRKHFGGIKAVDGCSFTVPRGSITGLIGPNGSGKSTVFNLIDNTIAADAGTIVFDGEHIEKVPAWGRAHRGIGRTYQITRLFAEMTVLENVVAAQRSFSLTQLGRPAITGKEAAEASEFLAFVGMHKYRDQKARALSYGQQKMVELAQVLMLDPKLIMLDEPAGGINPVLIERMGQMIRELNSYGKTFLIVEHNMPFMLDLCDPIHVLARGATMASGTPDEIRTDPAVIDAYLGDDFTSTRQDVH